MAHWLTRYDPDCGEPYGELCNCEIGDDHDGTENLTEIGDDDPDATIAVPQVVTLCGSTRFRDEFIAETRRLTLDGIIVISVGVFGHHEPDFDPDGPAKAMLDALHLRKIDMAERIHVINPGGYVGASTRREIAYAAGLGKAVTYYCPPVEATTTTTAGGGA